MHGVYDKSHVTHIHDLIFACTKINEVRKILQKLTIGKKINIYFLIYD